MSTREHLTDGERARAKLCIREARTALSRALKALTADDVKELRDQLFRAWACTGEPFTAVDVLDRARIERECLEQAEIERRRMERAASPEWQEKARAYLEGSPLLDYSPRRPA